MRLVARFVLLAIVTPAAACEYGGGTSAGAVTRVDPATLYGQMCARCHGADGKGDPQMRELMPVADLTAPAFHDRVSTEEIERIIMGGRNQMPAFGGSISTLKIQALAGHVRRLRAP